MEVNQCSTDITLLLIIVFISGRCTLGSWPGSWLLCKINIYYLITQLNFIEIVWSLINIVWLFFFFLKIKEFAYSSKRDYFLTHFFEYWEGAVFSSFCWCIMDLDQYYDFDSILAEHTVKTAYSFSIYLNLTWSCRKYHA